MGFGKLLLEPGELLGFRQGDLRRRGRRDLLDGGVLLAEKIKETFSQRLAELEHAL